MKIKLFTKINIVRILQAHGNTLVDARTQRPGTEDWVTFVVIPVAFSLLVSKLNVSLGENAITIIITSLSIFVGLLFNMVVLVFDILKRDATNDLKNKLLKQILANISFTILLSIFIIALSLIALTSQPIIKMLTDFLIFFFISVFFLTLVMILKRMYALFENEMKEMEKKAKEKANAKVEELEENI